MNQELLDILACPICKTPVSQKEQYIVCQQCGRRYPIRNNIPIMLIDDAEPKQTLPANNKQDE